ncbi:MAG: isocitrate lyase/phosphoenolpyruvate mutase family protein, partial [Alphaproteobacteria bacterium]|nr:isocitrate lyase/phosphoenolpyruvate mutase family protein [Alphaproteobacteria bacterium]
MEQNTKKSVGFISMTLPQLEAGHIEALEYCLNRSDELVVGLVVDALCFKSNISQMGSFEQRKALLSALYPQLIIVPQDTWSGEDVIEKHTPDIVFHSDDYNRVPEEGIKRKLHALSKSKGFKMQEFSRRSFDSVIEDTYSRCSVYSLLKKGKKVCAADIYDHISTFNVTEQVAQPNSILNAAWGSSLTFSASRLREDTEFFSLQERITEYARMLQDVTLPLVIDGDTGGTGINLGKSVKLMDAYGMDCLVIEDKIGSKSNSLVRDSNVHVLADLEALKSKFATIRESTANPNFIAIA